jgi:acetyltransferase-like isoleucine patch superfamily enzyme
MKRLYGELKYFAKQVAGAIFTLMKSSNQVSRFEKLKRAGIVIVGRHSYGTPVVFTYPGNDCKLRIGNFVSITDGAQVLLGGNHPANWVSTFPFRARFALEGAFRDGMPASNGDVVIEHDVWIGANCTILSGVTIGCGAIVASGSVVTGRVPPYAIVGGVNAKIIRYRFSQDVIEALLRLRWWDMSDEDITPYIELLSSERVLEFLRLCGPKQE